MVHQWWWAEVILKSRNLRKLAKNKKATLEWTISKTEQRKLSALTKDRKSTLVPSKSVTVSEASLEVSSCRQIGGTADYGAHPAPPLIVDDLSYFLNLPGSQHLLLEIGVQESTHLDFVVVSPGSYSLAPKGRESQCSEIAASFQFLSLSVLTYVIQEKSISERWWNTIWFFSVHKALSSTWSYFFITENCEVRGITVVIPTSSIT